MILWRFSFPQRLFFFLSIWVVFCQWLLTACLSLFKIRRELPVAGSSHTFYCRNSLFWQPLPSSLIHRSFRAVAELSNSWSQWQTLGSVRWEPLGSWAVPVTWNWTSSSNLPVWFFSLVWLRGCHGWELHISVSNDRLCGEYRRDSHPSVLVYCLQLKI